MTRWQQKQIIKKRKEEYKAHILGIIGAGLFGLVVALCMVYAK